MALTRRERFCKLYDFQKVDRPVHWEAVGIWRQTVDQWKQAGTLPQDADAMDYYGFEPRPTVSGGLGLCSMALSGPPVQERILKDDGYTRVVEDDLGAVRRERSDGGQSMPEWIKFPVESHQDWLDKIKPRLSPGAHTYGDLDKERADAEAHPEDPIGLYLVGLYAFWRNFWGMEKLAYAFFDSPQTLHEMANTWLGMHCECSPRVLEAVPADYVLFHEDMAFKNGPLISPELFNQFMFPYYRELFAHFRGHGLRRFMLDSDGNNGEILERFVELGMNGMYPFEQAAGCNVLAFRKRHPGFFIWGAMDKRVLLKTKEDIEREVMEKAPDLWETGGFIPSIDHSVPPCPQGNFEYFLELVRAL